MQKRLIWTIGITISLVIACIVAGIAYAAYFASTVTESQKHTPTGEIKETQTLIPTGPIETFQIVPDQTTASYGVYEDLIFEQKPHNQAIGKTTGITGNIQLRLGKTPGISQMNITVDLRTLQSDRPMRDQYIQQNTLQTDTYPYATFTSTGIQGLPSNYKKGQTVSFQLLGNLTLHGKTNGETFAVQGKIDESVITGTATTTIYMTDFGIRPPNLANIAIAQNKVLITLNFTAKKG